MPYASYFRNFIIDIDRRQDIADNPALRACLDVSICFIHLGIDADKETLTRKSQLLHLLGHKH